jgi:putative protease
MAIACPRCGAGFDVTLFQFGRRVRCDCGAWVDLASGHTRPAAGLQPERNVAMVEVELGRVTHYFSKIGVAAIEITQDRLTVGDTIHVKGHTSDFTQTIDSMQVDGKSVTEATAGQSIGIKAADHARVHDHVFKVVG